MTIWVRSRTTSTPAAGLLGLAAGVLVATGVLLAANVSLATKAEASMAPARCHPVRGAVDGIICGSPEYLAMDREIAALTDRAMAEFSKPDRRRLAESELHYFSQRKGCEWAAHHSAHPGAAMDECVRTSMESRVRALRVLVERGRF